MVSARPLLGDALVVSPVRHGDARGWFSETYNRAAFSSIGIDDVFVQDNQSLSRDTGVVRGLHFQIDPHPIAKLLGVVQGAVWDVVVDLRHGSATFGKHASVELTASEGDLVYVPRGFAHGFVTLTPDTQVAYKVTDHWHPEVDKGVAWDDPDLAIPWPVTTEQAILSDKDRRQPSFRELPAYFTWTEQ